jgi:hypothetical protein
MMWMESEAPLVSRQLRYKPLPSQVRFHNSGARFKGFSGPVGSGKSAALCHEAIRLAYLNPRRQGLVGAPTYAMLKDATAKALIEILESNEIPYDHNRGESYLTLRDTGSQILLRSMEEYERLRGTNLAWFGLDELTYTHAEAWTRLEARLRDPQAARLCGFAVWTPKAMDWVYERFIKNPVEGYEVIQAEPFENQHLLAAVPDFYERLKQSYDEQFYAQEVLGAYLEAAGNRVYEAFRRDGNVFERAYDPKLDLHWSLDFNVSPLCSIVAQKIGEEADVIDEIVIDDGLTEQACAEFIRRYGKHTGGIQVYGDASGNNRRTSGPSDFALVQKALAQARCVNVRFQVPHRNPAVEERVRLVNRKLRNAAGQVELRISPRCRELIRDLEAVGYKPGTLVIDKERDRRRTHLSDALGYFLCQAYSPLPSYGARQERLF